MPSNDVCRPPGGETPALPWWHFGIVWFTLGLPALVVIASLATASIAWRHVDPLVVEAQPGRASQEPAERARNHAATPKR